MKDIYTSTNKAWLKQQKAERAERLYWALARTRDFYYMLPVDWSDDIKEPHDRHFWRLN